MFPFDGGIHAAFLGNIAHIVCAFIAPQRCNFMQPYRVIVRECPYV